METFPLKLKCKKICRANATNKNAFFFWFVGLIWIAVSFLDANRSPADQIKVSTARDATMKDESQASLSRKI